MGRAGRLCGARYEKDRTLRGRASKLNSYADVMGRRAEPECGERGAMIQSRVERMRDAARPRGMGGSRRSTAKRL